MPLRHLLMVCIAVDSGGDQGGVQRGRECHCVAVEAAAGGETGNTGRSDQTDL